MAKVTITFDTCDDRTELRQAIHAGDAWLVLWEFDSILRGSVKYGKGLDDQQIRDQLHELLAGHGVSLDDMVE